MVKSSKASEPLSDIEMHASKNSIHEARKALDIDQAGKLTRRSKKLKLEVKSKDEDYSLPLDVSPREVEFSQNKLIRPVERDREERKENEGEERTRNDK